MLQAIKLSVKSNYGAIGLHVRVFVSLRQRHASLWGQEARRVNPDPHMHRACLLYLIFRRFFHFISMRKLQRHVDCNIARRSIFFRSLGVPRLSVRASDWISASVGSRF